MLTDQVEAQGAKISDLQSSLVEHRQKLRSTGEMLQQVQLHTPSVTVPKIISKLRKWDIEFPYLQEINEKGPQSDCLVLSQE